MNLVGLTLLRNEDWVCAYSLRAALRWCDHLVVLLHACTDATQEIVWNVSREMDRLTVVTEAGPSFDEMDFRQSMLEEARRLDATHIATCDGDEILTAHLASQIRRRISMLPSGGVLITPIHNLWGSLDRFRCDGSPFGRAFVVLAFCDAPWVTWQPAEDGYQFHQRLPAGRWLSPMRWPSERLQGGLMHLQHASRRRLLAKQALYKVQEVLRWPHRDRGGIDRLYSRTVDEADAVLLDVPPEWWAHGIDRGLIQPDREPWQEVELRRLLDAHGREAFADLDLFSVDLA